jgi:hypothetical protein
VQALQALPAVPHVEAVFPLTHWPDESQQPAQLAELQFKVVLSTHLLLALHIWVEPHTAHCMPPLPHSTSAVPGWQVHVTS